MMMEINAHHAEGQGMKPVHPVRGQAKWRRTRKKSKTSF